MMLKYERSKGEMLSNNKEIKFIWIPGVRPVIIPKKIPAIIKNNISKYII